MKAIWFPFKVIYDDLVIDVNTLENAYPFLRMRHTLCRLNTQSQLPFFLHVTYGIKTTQEKVLSIVGQAKALLEFTKGEGPAEELRILLISLLFEIEMLWIERTMYTELYGKILSPEPAIQNSIINDIIEAAQREGIL